jgi:hypothetical protein
VCRQALRTGHAFLNDIAHNAVRERFSTTDPGGHLASCTDDDDVAGMHARTRRPQGAYDDELLDATSSPATAAATKTLA